MSSNTKLTREQKALRKEMLAEFRGTMLTSPCGRFTVGKVPEFLGSRMALLAVAVASPEEAKFRRKVGEFLVLSALVHGNGRYVVVPADFDLECFLEILSYCD